MNKSFNVWCINKKRSETCLMGNSIPKSQKFQYAYALPVFNFVETTTGIKSQI